LVPARRRRQVAANFSSLIASKSCTPAPTRLMVQAQAARTGSALEAMRH
jgi:hypothetical protein